MANVPPRPAVAINGVPTWGDSDPKPAEGAAPAASGREDARLNMLRKIRPPPLKYAWTMYHDKHSDGTNYDGRLTVLLENIINVKHFWTALNHFPMQALAMKDSVHFFKRGVKPVWEDPRNVDGGSWTFRVPKDKSETFFHEVLMLCVGEQFADVIQPKDDLCGCSLSTRFNSNLITIWNRDGTNQKSIDGLVQVVLDRISPELKPKENSFYYKKHSEHQGFDEAIAKARAKKILSPANVPETEPEVNPAEVRQEEVEQAERDEARKLEEASKVGLKLPKEDPNAPAPVDDGDGE
jgi:Eukaryotic initiation factor 4E